MKMSTIGDYTKLTSEPGFVVYDALRRFVVATMEAEGYSQYVLSRRSGIPVSTLNNYLLGKHNIRGMGLIAVLEALGLFDDKGGKPQEQLRNAYLTQRDAASDSRMRPR